MNKVDFILILLLIMTIATVFTGIYMIKTKGTRCLVSPLTYGAEILEKYYGEMNCACSNGISFNKFNMTRVIKLYSPSG